MYRLTGCQAGRGTGGRCKEILALRKERRSRQDCGIARSWAEWMLALAENRSRGRNWCI